MASCARVLVVVLHDGRSACAVRGGRPSPGHAPDRAAAQRPAAELARRTALTGAVHSQTGSVWELPSACSNPACLVVGVAAWLGLIDLRPVAHDAGVLKVVSRQSFRT